MATREEAKKFAAQNRRAQFDFFIDDTLEAGIMLTGTEVKSLRGGRASVNEVLRRPEGGELYLFNAYIPEYLQAGRIDQHEPKRPRKLLIRRRELDKLAAGIKQKGVTLDSDVGLFQRPRHGQGRDRRRHRQEKARQAGHREGPRLAARQGAADARQELRV